MRPQSRQGFKHYVRNSLQALCGLIKAKRGLTSSKYEIMFYRGVEVGERGITERHAKNLVSVEDIS